MTQPVPHVYKEDPCSLIASSVHSVVVWEKYLALENPRKRDEYDAKISFWTLRS